MTAGEQVEGVIPAVPKGFVRCVQLYSINKPSARGAKKTDRSVYYIYCGDRVTAPDTAGWEPFGEQLAAAMADKLGSQRIRYMHNVPSTLSELSVERVLEENPVLVSAGVTLKDFSFTISSVNRLASFPLKGGALKCCGCGRWHNVPEKVMHEVRCPLEVVLNAMQVCRVATSCSDWLWRVCRLSRRTVVAASCVHSRVHGAKTPPAHSLGVIS